MTSNEKTKEEDRPPLQEEDIGGPTWASSMTGLTVTQIVVLAKEGRIPGAFKLGRGPHGWRFHKPQFLRWLQEQIARS